MTVSEPHSFDLVPEAYRRRRSLMLLLKRFAGSAVCIIGLMVIVAAALGQQSAQLESDIEQLRLQQDLDRQQQQHVSDLNASVSTQRERWQLLEGLRSGLSAAEVMSSVEAALPAERVWLTEWAFRRAGIVTNDEPEPRPPSYFVRLESKSSDPWQAVTHMTLTGQAVDHKALSEFASELLRTPSVADVRIQRTLRGRGRDGSVIAFEVAVSVQTSIDLSEVGA